MVEQGRRGMGLHYQQDRLDWQCVVLLSLEAEEAEAAEAEAEVVAGLELRCEELGVRAVDRPP